MAYDPKKDKVLKDFGSIVLAEEPEYRAFRVRVVKYGGSQPKLALQMEVSNWNKKSDKDPDTIIMSKIPRLSGEEVDKLCAGLPDKLAKAKAWLDEPPEPKKRKKKE